MVTINIESGELMESNVLDSGSCIFVEWNGIIRLINGNGLMYMMGNKGIEKRQIIW